MITVLHGSNRLEIDERVQALRAECDPGGLNTTVVEDAATRLAEVRSTAAAPGFFGSVRLVVAHGLIAGRSVGRSRKARKGGEPEDDWAALLAAVPPSTLLVLVEPPLGAAEERAVRAAAPDARIERLDVPRGRALVDWVAARARRYEAVIPPDVAGALLEALFPSSWRAVARRDDVPPDLLRIDGEIAKLATAAGRGGTVTLGDVAALVPGAEFVNVWGLADAIAAGDPAAAVREVESLLASGTPAEVILGQLSAQFETYAALHVAGRRGDLAAVAAETGLTEGRLQQASRSAPRFPAARTRAALAALHAIDLAAKQGQIEAEQAIVGLVARLASAR